MVALDGQRAVVCVDYSVLGPDNKEQLLERVPLPIDLRDGQYGVPYDAMLRLMGLQP